MAIDCMAGYIYTLIEDKEEIPAPSPFKSVTPEAVIKHQEMEDLPYEEAFVNIVLVDVQDYARKHFEKAVKKTLTIPKWLNERAVAMGVNFSQVLQEALLEKIRA